MSKVEHLVYGDRKVFTVSAFNRGIGMHLSRLPALWVEGEVTGARPAPKGHHYFCLRDEREDAAIDMVMYRTSLTQRARALLVDGARVRLRGRRDAVARARFAQLVHAF